ncbi:MAG: LPS assembly lipoprotein LptE [Thermodesulfobacteriota bacterium]|nr:LPS assembly lipoprotein LptE [Thermodesulfobacteriota bacterium]
MLDGGGTIECVSLCPSQNLTMLNSASMALDTSMEQQFAAMGMLCPDNSGLSLESSITRSYTQEITSAGPSKLYRLYLEVSSKLYNQKGTMVWHSAFKDRGTYADTGQDEDALNEACNKIAEQIAREVTALCL